MSVVRVNGIDINYEVTDFTDPWAEPETILLHHGFARSLRFWYRWVPQLCRHYRVVTFDSRGCGKTTVPPEDLRFSADELADDAIGLLDALKIDRVHWGSEASGGIVGINAALRHPQRLASLTMCNTPIKLPKATNDLFVEEDVRKYGTAHWARKSATNRFDMNALQDGYLEWSIAEHGKTPAQVAIAIHGMLMDADNWPLLPEIKVPTLMIAGDGSKIAPLEEMKKMSDRIPGARLVVFEGYGQGIAFSQTDRCVAEMLKFLAELRGIAG